MPLDTAGKCFLCLSPANNKSPVCLREISKYLKITTEFEFSGKIFAAVCSVTLCSDCNKVSENLSNLLKEAAIEAIEEQLEQALLAFYRRIQTDNVEEISWAVNLRRIEIKDKCKEKLFSDNKLVSSPMKSIPPPNSNSPSISITAKPCGPNKLPDKQIDTGSSKEPSGRNPFKNLYIAQKGVEEGDGGNKYSCSTCNDFHPSDKSVRDHIISTHPEKLFPDCQLKWTTDDEFKSKCAELLEKLSLRFQYNAERKIIENCPFCVKRRGGNSTQLSAYENQTVHDHLFNEHYKYLVEILTNAQEKERTRREQKRNETTETCP